MTCEVVFCVIVLPMIRRSLRHKVLLRAAAQEPCIHISNLTREGTVNSCRMHHARSCVRFMPCILLLHFSTCICPQQINCATSILEKISFPVLSVFSLPKRCIHKRQQDNFPSNELVTLKEDDKGVRFAVDRLATNVIGYPDKCKSSKQKMSRKAKIKELRFYRLKARKKMKSPNPEVRIRYKLEKAKRKEEWLIQKLRKFGCIRHGQDVHDPELLTEEERFYLKRTGEKKKNYVQVGRRGVFGEVVLNMHLHWKRHETVKVVCKPCKPGQICQYAEELARLSKGIVIDVKADNTIIFYRGKNYLQPELMTPPGLLPKLKALEKYKLQQSLEHTSQFIEKLENELEDCRNYVALAENQKTMVE